jgi:glycogen operon protein
VRGGCLCAFVPRTTPGLGVPKDWLARAELAGVQAQYEDNTSRRRLVPFATLARLLACLHPREPDTATLPAPGPQCWVHPDLRGMSRRWILSLQWYGLHSAQSWGIGDFVDIGRFAQIAAAAGAAGVMLSPLHAPSLCAPDKASPYSPSSRFVLNPLLISLPQLDDDERSPAYGEFLERPDTQAALERARGGIYVDYPEVARLKLAALGATYCEFAQRHLGDVISVRGAQFRRFQEDHLAVMRPYAVFEALCASLGPDRSAWPPALQACEKRAIDIYVGQHRREVEFYEYLQWIASCQWDRAVAQAHTAGLQIGFIADLALGADVDGAEAWQWRDLIIREIELGAPPDAFAPHGQAWGLPPWHPHKLAELQYQPFIELLGVVTHGAGALRIDHVMGLMRQFWLPRGEPPDRGAYVRFPFEALLDWLAQTSVQRRCMIIGEDLGNVPPSLRERLSAANVLGYRVVYFERDSTGAFMSPQHYPRDSLAALTTHDLPTLLGFCAEADIAERERMGMDAVSVSELRSERKHACAALVRALRDYGYADDASNFADAAHRFLAATNSGLVIVQIEDVVGMRRQANLPGTDDRAPNWRQRLAVALEDLATDSRMRNIAQIFSARRRGA